MLPLFQLVILALCTLQCNASKSYLVLGIQEDTQIFHFLAAFFNDEPKSQVKVKNVGGNASLLLKETSILGPKNTKLLLVTKPLEDDLYLFASSLLRWAEFGSIDGIILYGSDPEPFEGKLKYLIPIQELKFIHYLRMEDENHLIIDYVTHSWGDYCPLMVRQGITESLDNLPKVTIASTASCSATAELLVHHLLYEYEMASTSLFTDIHDFFLASIWPVKILESALKKKDLDIVAYLIMSLPPRYLQDLERAFPTLGPVIKVLQGNPKNAMNNFVSLGYTLSEARLAFISLKKLTFVLGRQILDIPAALMLEPSQSAVPIFYPIILGRLKSVSEQALVEPYLHYFHWFVCCEQSAQGSQHNLSRAQAKLHDAIKDLKGMFAEHLEIM